MNDRQNHRVQVFDENGKYLREVSFGPPPSDIHLFIITADRDPVGRGSRHVEDD